MSLNNFIKTISEKDIFVFSIIMFIAYLQIFTYGEYLFFWDNEEIFLTTKIELPFLEYISDKLPYNGVSTGLFWIQYHFLGSDVNSLRLATNIFSLFLIIYIYSLKYQLKLSNIIILVILFFYILNYRHFLFYSNWAVSSYILSMLLHIYVFVEFYKISTVNSSMKKVVILSISLFMIFFIHPDLLISYASGFAMFILFQTNSFFKNWKKYLILILPAVANIWIIFSYFNISKELSRTHLHYLFYLKQDKFDSLILFLEDRISYMLNELTMIIFPFNLQPYLIWIIFLFLLFVPLLTLFLKSKDNVFSSNYEQLKIYTYSYLIINFILLLLMNLLNLHPLGQIRYGLFFIFPFTLLIGFGLYEMIYISNIYIKKILKVKKEYLLLFFEIVFILILIIGAIETLKKRFYIRENTMNIQKILKHEEAMILSDHKYMYKLNTEYKDRFIINIGSAIKGRKKYFPTEEIKNKVLSYPEVISITFGKNLTHCESYPNYCELFTNKFNITSEYKTERGITFTLWEVR